MAKNVIFNVLINVAIVFLILMGATAYKSGNALVLGACIAFLVLLIYLKVVLVKHVRRNYMNKTNPPIVRKGQPSKKTKRKK